MSSDSYNYTNNEDVKDSKYWLMKDLNIFKKWITKISKIFFIILMISLIISLFINFTYQTFYIPQILITALLFFPLVLLGYFFIYSFIYKGNIYSDNNREIINELRKPKSDIK